MESPFFHRENATLQKELKKAQELLQQSQTDYENLSTKYINVSAKVREQPPVSFPDLHPEWVTAIFLHEVKSEKSI